MNQQTTAEKMMATGQRFDHPALSEFGLWGKTAIVTGAASGIGNRTARLFSSEGANVVIADRNKDAAEAGAKAISGLGGYARAVETEVADES